jgi:hypothetical protein
MKTSELKGAALDWAVAKCDNRKISFNHGGGLEVRGRTEDGEELPDHWDLWMPWHPSTSWAQGGPIIEREGISVQVDPTDPNNIVQGLWSAYFRDKLFEEDGSDCFSNGETALIAAMRCYVASKLGYEVEIPEILM